MIIIQQLNDNHRSVPSLSPVTALQSELSMDGEDAPGLGSVAFSCRGSRADAAETTHTPTRPRKTHFPTCWKLLRSNATRTGSGRILRRDSPPASEPNHQGWRRHQTITTSPRITGSCSSRSCAPTLADIARSEWASVQSKTHRDRTLLTASSCYFTPPRSERMCADLTVVTPDVTAGSVWEIGRRPSDDRASSRDARSSVR